MKIFLTLSVLFSVGSLLAQSGSGGGSGAAGGTTASGLNPGTSVQRSVGGTTPALGSPVRTLPANVSPLTTSPATQTPAGQIPAGQTLAGQTAAGISGQADQGGGNLELVPAPQGIQPVNPTVSPLTNAPAGAITNLLRQDLEGNLINEPAGASPDQGSINEGAGSETGIGPLNGTDAFAQQFQGATSANGNTQLAFPAQNAVVTIICENGALTLRGVVSNPQQRESIEQALRGISSGTFIDNQIQVSASGTSTIVP